MKKYFRMLIALAVVILLVVIGTAQASQFTQAANPDASGISSVYPLNRWKTDYIYTAGNAGSNVSMAFDPDHGDAAWVSYYADNGTWGNLEVAHFVGVGSPSSNCGPSNSWHCQQVDAGNTGYYRGLATSIDIYPDTDPRWNFSTWKVGVSYFDATNKALKYAEYTCPPLDVCDWTIYTVDSSSDPIDEVGRYTSMKFDPTTGIPNIAYYVYEPDGLFGTYYVKRAYYEGSGGNCGDSNHWQCETVDSSIFITGRHPSLDFNYEGAISIAYDAINVDNSVAYQALKYAYYGGIGDCTPGGSWICFVIDQTTFGENYIGFFPSWHAPQDSTDVYRVAYYDSTLGKLKYATSGHSGNGNCGSADSWQCDAIDDMGVGLTWASVSLAVDSSHTPMIAYTDAHEDLAPLALKVAEPAYGQPYANCAGDILYDWFCAKLDSGNQYLDEAGFLSLGIKSNGLAMIAYSEENTYEYPTSYDLKFAYQTVWSFLPITIK